MDGEFIDFEAARVPILTHTLHYGLGVFEGILAVLPVAGAVYFYGKYRIDKQRHRQILDELEVVRNV